MIVMEVKFIKVILIATLISHYIYQQIPTAKDFLFQNFVFNTSLNLTLTLTFYQGDGNRYANSSISVNMLPIQIPPSMVIYIDDRMDDSEKMPSFFLINTTSNYTNSKGEVNVTLYFWGYYYGFWVTSFTAGSASTYPFFFRTEFPVGNIEIKTQPAINTTIPHAADVFMTVPKIYASDTNGKPLPYTVVSVVFDEGSGCSNGTTIAMMDQYTYGCASNSQLTSFVTTISSYYSKAYYTDENGMMTLDLFGIMDVAGKACVKFRFVIGEPGMVFFSEPTNEVCVINDYVFDVRDEISSKVADNQPFNLPATVAIKRENRGKYDTEGFITIAAFVKFIDSEEQTDREASSERVLQYNYCQFYYGYSMDGYCTDLKVVKDNNPFIATTNFTSLQWRKPTLSSTFQLQFSSVLQKDTAALSSPIEVVSTPTNLNVNIFLLTFCSLQYYLQRT